MSGPAASPAPLWSADLDWALRALWGGSEDVEVSRPGAVTAGWRTVDSFGVLPSASHPRLLLPLSSGRAAAQAVRDHASHRLAVRVAKPLVARAVRHRLGRRLLRDRVCVSVPGGMPSDAFPRQLVKEYLREVLGREDLEMAVKFDAPRPHRKPTLQLLDAEGRVLAYAKVGWNPVTRQLVRTEANVLQQLDRLPSPSSFEVPSVLHAGRWQGLELLVIAPLATGPRRRTSPPLKFPPVAATVEVTSLGELRHGPLQASYWWTATRRRLARVEATLGARPALERSADALERRHGGTDLSYGFWHGDWVSANMSVKNGRLSVWDWERGGPLAPVGLDAIHFEYQAALTFDQLSPDAAVGRVLDRPTSSLSALGLPEALRPVLLSLHLLEMSLRFDEARAGGVDTEDRKYRRPLEALLSSG